MVARLKVAHFHMQAACFDSLSVVSVIGHSMPYSALTRSACTTPRTAVQFVSYRTDDHSDSSRTLSK